MRTPLARWTLLALVSIAALGAGLLVDPYAYRHFFYPDWWNKHPHHMFRLAGYLGTWALMFLLVRWFDTSESKPSPWRDLRRRLFTVPLLAGVATMAVKLLVRRQRPARWEGFTLFEMRPFGDRLFDGSNLCFPSEHAAIGVAGAVVLTHFYPRGKWIWITWAAGCALSRVANRAHYFSDVVGGTILGLLVANLVLRYRPGQPPDILHS